MEKKRRIGKANSEKKKRSTEEEIKTFPVPMKKASPDAVTLDLQDKKRILVVDDDELMLEAISEIVGSEHKQYEILTAKNGEEGLQSVRQEGGRIDLIITDWKHPKIDGITMSKIIKKEYPHIRIVMFSGFLSDIVDKLPQEVFFSASAKPLTAAELLEMVDAALRSKEKKE